MRTHRWPYGSFSFIVSLSLVVDLCHPCHSVSICVFLSQRLGRFSSASFGTILRGSSLSFSTIFSFSFPSIWVIHGPRPSPSQTRRFPVLFPSLLFSLSPLLSSAICIPSVKSQAFSDPWRRSKQFSSNEDSRGLLSNHNILIPFTPSSRTRSSLTL